MHLAFLRSIDRWLGFFLLNSLVLPVRVLRSLFPTNADQQQRHIFLKLKGGGSLVIAMPALLGLRRKFPNKEFVLVCTRDAQIYAELLGVFDRYLVIDDETLLTLVATGLRALHFALRSAWCVDLEPNSLLASVFTMGTCSAVTLGLVKHSEPFKAVAYTKPLEFDPGAPIHLSYDQVCRVFGAEPATHQECLSILSRRLPTPSFPKPALFTVGMAAFTSDFAKERMMPLQTWGKVLAQAFEAQALTLLIFGADRHKKAAHEMACHLKTVLPLATIVDLSGTGDLSSSASAMTVCDEVWAVDSGLLHIARALGRPTRSFWGPTKPSQRLRPIAGVLETNLFLGMLCAPCVQRSTAPACGGLNLCMINMAEPNPDLAPPWTRPG